MNHQSLAAFVWSIADLLRGDYRQSDYGKVVLPFTLLRRLDCVLEKTKDDVLAEYESKKDSGLNLDPFLTRKSGQSFYNTSKFDLRKLLGDPVNIKSNLLSYVASFSENSRDIFDRYEFESQVKKLDEANLLFQIVQRFAQVDLHPEKVDNQQMGLMFEELIRRFAEISNETAGEHYTPREVIRLMVDLLFAADDEALTKPGVVRTIYDPTAGTGGMLSTAEEHLVSMNPEARLSMHGQELNPESYAICKADMIIKGQDVGNIVFGNTLSEDGHAGKKFDYMLSNPPFGVEWKKVEKEVRAEFERLGYSGRFGPGLPRVSDGSLLFLLHLLSKMRPAQDGGSRIGIVLNGSPLFSGGAGSGESEIRRWIIESDWLETIVALPPDMFYNTGISTYVWILSNRKAPERKGKIQLVDASAFWEKMPKTLGSKRKRLSAADISDIVRICGTLGEQKAAMIYGADGKLSRREILPASAPTPEAPEGGKVEAIPVSKIFRGEEFGYRTIVVERPLRISAEATGKCQELFNDFVAANAQAGLAKARPPVDGAVAIDWKNHISEIVGAFMKILRNGRFLSAADGIDLTRRAKVKWSEASVGLLANGLLDQALHEGIWEKAWDIVEAMDPTGEVAKDKKGNPVADSTLRDTENVPLTEEVEDYFKREVLPHVPDAWIDHDKTKVGYEIPFNRHFYVYKPPRALHDIDEDLKHLSAEIVDLLNEVADEA